MIMDPQTMPHQLEVIVARLGMRTVLTHLALIADTYADDDARMPWFDEDDTIVPVHARTVAQNLSGDFF